MIIPFLQASILPLLQPLLPPLHLLTFSTLLGTQLYQTTIITRLTFTSLPRGPFVRLQKSLWPVYFRIQSLLFLFSALTLPGLSTGRGLALVIGGAIGALNWTWAGPWARRVMLERAEIGQDKDAEQSGPDMQTLKRRFKTSHAMSIHLNLICIIATLWHVWGLASLLQF